MSGKASDTNAAGRFGMGELELLPLDDDEDGEKCEKGVEGGWDALKALIDEDEEEEDEDAAVDEEDEEEELSEGDAEAGATKAKENSSVKAALNSGGQTGVNAAVSGAAITSKATGTSTALASPKVSEKDSSIIGNDGVKEEDLNEDSEVDEAEDFNDLGESGEEEAASFGGVSELSDRDDEDSYKGSELDPLDAPRCEDSDADSDEVISRSDDDDMELGEGGLLTSLFSGGSLHSERAKGKGGGKSKKPSSIRVVFPSLIWRGSDILVVNKPADWICSASDVDKKKGRALDPLEKVANKGFKALSDLLNYEFCDREKKYIHWWIQLLHDLDREAYPNLFDEDQNYGLCHRLDRETSGTVLVGLTQLSRTQMRECFHRHYVRKLYVCLVHGIVSPVEQTIDRNLEAIGQKARLHANGKRARTHVKVLGSYTRTKDGTTEEFSLCTCEIAEGRMHQIRLHMSEALGAPIVSEFYYQEKKQMAEDRRWCERVFLHAYAVGFPDVSGEKRRIGVGNGNETKGDEANASPSGDEKNDRERSKNAAEPSPDAGLVDEEKRDTEQEWHACICPLTVELRDALKELEPKNEASALLRNTVVTSGLLEEEHEEIHVMGTVTRKNQIDNVFFPWSSGVNPIEAGDLFKARDSGHPDKKGGGKGDKKGGGKGENGVALRPKARPKRPLARRGVRAASASPPRRPERVRKRLRVASRGRVRSPGPPPPPRSRSPGSPPPGPPPPPRQGRLGVRSRSGGRPVRGRRSLSRRPPGAPPSPRRSPSALAPPPPRRKRRRVPVSPTRCSVSPLPDRLPLHRGGPSGPRGRSSLLGREPQNLSDNLDWRVDEVPPPPLARRRRGGGGVGGGGSAHRN